MAKNACATVVKNGGARFAEWLAFHLAIGMDSILVLDNGSTDNTVNVAKAFQSKFDVRIADWPRTDPSYQRAGFEYLLREAKDEFEWVACIDSDEFIVLPPERGLDRLLDLPQDISAIAMPWAMFGSNGHQTRPKDLIIRSYLRRAAEDFGPNKHIKSIVRPSHFSACENVHFYSVIGSYVDMLHRHIDVNSALLDGIPDYSGGQLNHYFVQSKNDWSDKLARGYHDCTRTFDEFYYYDRNDVFDNKAALQSENVLEILESISISDDVFPQQILPEPLR